MSQLHHLELTAAAGPLESVARELRDVAVGAGLVVSATEPPGRPVDAVLTLRSGLWASVSPPIHSGPDPFIADFGVARASTVDLQTNATRPIGPQIDDLLDIVLELLDRLPGDAVLHYGYSEVWLVRRDGRLLLSDSDDIWRLDRLARFPGPYERVPLRFADSSA